MARRKYTKEEVKQIRKERKIKAALRSYRFRGLKNFLFWLTGLISAFVLLISAIFVGVKFIPISTYVGDTGEVVSKDVSSKSILDAILDAQTYDMTDFPFIADALDSFVKGANLDKYVEIDVEKMKKLKFDSSFTTEIQSCIKVVATLDSVGGVEMLGDFAKLDIFSEWKEVESKDLPATTGGVINKNDSGEFAYNPKLYYYKAGVGSGNVLMSASSSGEYVRVFDNDGCVVDGYNGETIYFANLAKVPILDVVDLLDESIGRLELTNIIGSFGGGEGFEDSFLGGILDGKNISDLENFKAEDILLSSILGEYNDDTKLMYDILCSIVKTDGDKPTYDTLSLAHLQGGIEFNGVLISNFITEESTLELISSLVKDSAGNPIAPDALTLGDLMGINMENINLDGFALSQFLGEYEDNKEIYDLLHSMINWEGIDDIPEAKDLTIGHLMQGISMENINFDNFSLSMFLGEYEQNKEMYDLLHSMINWEGVDDIPEAKDLTIAHLMQGISMENINFDNFSLSMFLGEYEQNKEMYDLLHSMIKWDDKDDIPEAKDLTIGHLMKGISMENINYDNFSLSMFLGEYEENQEMYDLLHSMINWEGVDDIPEAKDLTIGHLMNGISVENLDADGMSLESFLGSYTDNQEMYDLLHSMINWEGVDDIPEAKDLTIGHLKNGISIDKLDLDGVSLSRFLGEYQDNKEMYDILHSVIVWEGEGTKPTADKLTIGDLSNGIDFNNLPLSRFLGEYDTNKEMYDILHSIIVWENQDTKPTADKLTIGDLSNGVEFNNLPLSKFLGEYQDNKEMYDILHSIIVWEGEGTKPTADKLTIGDLSNGIEFNNMPLSKFLGEYDANKEMYDILHSIILWEDIENAPTADKLTVGDLSNGIDFDKIELDGIALSRFLGEYEDNKEMYDILHSIIVWEGEGTKPTADKLTIGDLSNGIEFNNLPLSKFLGDYDDNKFTYDILCSIIVGESSLEPADLTVGHLSKGLDFGNLMIVDLLKQEGQSPAEQYQSNKMLYDILCTAVGGGVTYDKLSVAHLQGNLSFDNVLLDTFFPYNAQENLAFYKILLSGCGYDVANMTDAQIGSAATSLKMSELNNFSEGDISLKTIIGEVDGSNTMLSALLKKNPSVTELGSAINSLSLYDVYGANCFEKRKDAVGVSKPTYNRIVDNGNITYVLDVSGNGEYVISEEAGVWLILCYTPEEDGVVKDLLSPYDGCRTKYTATKSTMTDLQNGTNIASTIGSATIRELVIIGLLEDSATLKAAYSGTLQEALALIKFSK